MRILNIPNSDPAKRDGPQSDPLDVGRVDSLEKISTSILQKLQAIEERISDLEKVKAMPLVTPAPTPAPDPAPTPAPLPAFQVAAPPSSSRTKIEVDTEAVKKNLLAKMWTYLNDKAA